MKHELIDGQVVAMAGAGVRHIDIVTHLSREILSHLKPPCRLMGNDTRVRASEHRDYYYPDLTIVCGERELLPGNTATLLNPTVIIEILSPSTEEIDRGPKFHAYLKIPSLKAYLLIAQDRYSVEIYSRQGDGWHYQHYQMPEDRIEIESIGVRLTVAEIYHLVKFPPRPDPNEASANG